MDSKKQAVMEEVDTPEEHPSDQQEALDLMKIGYTYENARAVISKRKLEELFIKYPN